MCPGLNREIGLSIEAHSKDDNSKEASNIARQLPVFPLPRLSRRRRRTTEGKTLGPFLVAWTGPTARPITSASTGAKGRPEAGPESVGRGSEGLKRRHFWCRQSEREVKRGCIFVFGLVLDPRLGRGSATSSQKWCICYWSLEFERIAVDHLESLTNCILSPYC